MSNSLIDSKRQLRNQGEKILERKLQVSRDDEAYYTSNKVYTNLLKLSENKYPQQHASSALQTKDKTPHTLGCQESGGEVYRYQQAVPDHFRILDDPRYRNVVHKQTSGEKATMLQVVSKVQGWITIDAEKQDRKRPVEKIRLGDASKVNALSPPWMQV